MENIEATLSLLGVVVTIASAVASALNEHIRNSKQVSKVLSVSQVAVNTLALNLDKVKGAVRVLKGKK